MFFWSRLRKSGGRATLALLSIITLMGTGLFMQPRSADAARDERTISFFEIHTGRRITITFKRDGKFIPAAMKKINWFMRDWRRNVPTKMDPRLIDLVWQLHEESGSKKPIHLVSGYRSPKTNAALRRRGGGQARKSQHMRGKAMDIHFPDVSMSTVRKIAFKHEIGGVGYYPTSAIPFVHVDTARVRSWPRMSRSQLAMIFPYGRTKHLSTSGRLTLRDQKRARVRLAGIARKKANRARILLARNSTPVQERRNRFRTPANTQASAERVIAALSNQTLNSPILEVPGMSRHARQLWVNQAGNRALPKTQAPTRQQAPATRPTRVAQNTPPARRALKRQRLPGSSLDQNWKNIHKRIQLASLPSQKIRPRARTAPRQVQPTKAASPKLWIDGSGLRASWLQEKTPKPAPSVQIRLPKKPAPSNIQPRTTIVASNVPQHTTIRQRTAVKITPQHYQAERVAYAPSYDKEHPDELAYRPFKILPLMSTKPVALNKTLVAMVEPRYDRIYEVIASSENLSMQFRPSAKDAADMWNSQFEGKAIINIRNRAEIAPRRPRLVRMASR